MATYTFPASYAQRRMWVLDRLDPGQPTYNVTWAMWLDGRLDAAALDAAWAAAVARHESLRTTIGEQAGGPVQVIEDDPPATGPEIVSLEHRPEAERDHAAHELLRELAGTPFDLDRPPLLRTRLIRLSPRRHVLGIVAHHVIADGWSFRLLFEEMAADYEAALAGGPPVSVEPPIQYADFALWQIEHADAGGYAADERFWRTALAGATLALPLPTDHPYPPHQTYPGGTVEVAVPEPVGAGLRALAAARGVTLFAVLLAGYAALLSRLTGCADLLVGVPVAARTRPETEAVVGLFANTVAVRVRLTAGTTLAELVDQVHTGAAAALVHQELPFARVVELCRPERDPARGPVVQAMFALDEPFPAPERGGLRWHPEVVDNGTIKVELDLAMVAGPTGLSGRLRYHQDLFTAASARRFAGHLARLLDTLGRAAGTRVVDVDILDRATRELVVDRWPRAAALPAGEPTAVALVTAAAAAGPADRVVARGEADQVTAAGLLMGAGRIAAGLRDLGVGRQHHVGVLLPRGAGLLPALLGVWWLGAAYVPLDAGYPAERLRAMLDDAGVSAIVTDRGPAGPVAAALAAIDPAVPVLDVSTVDDGAPGLDRPEPVPPTAAAYTIFTSGSTGRPKAVTVSQGALAALLRAFGALLPLGPDDRLVAVTTLAFDISVLELLLPVLRGGQVVVATGEQAGDGAQLRRLLVDSGATALQATPVTWRMLREAGGVPPAVRLRLCGGEALPRDLAAALATGGDGGAGVSLWNVYGPTETTVWSAAGRVEPGAPVAIGPPIPGSRLYLLDDALGPVPPGVRGEVCVGGAGVGQGYLGAPAATAERFRPDPYGRSPGARLYRTGDLGRWLGDGRIELAGRADRQVKVRGFRVETAEIEVLLRRHPEVADAVVTVRPGRADAGDAHLVAYLVRRPAPATGAQPAGPAELREHLRRYLPEYMLPATFVTLPELPRTPNGKVHHRALPEPRFDGGSSEPPRPPRTPLERELTQVFADLLGLAAPAGVQDNFFTLGGFSLAATRLMTRVRERYGVDLPVRVLFADPTVAGLARAIAGGAGAGDSDGDGRR